MSCCPVFNCNTLGVVLLLNINGLSCWLYFYNSLELIYF